MLTLEYQTLTDFLTGKNELSLKHHKTVNVKVKLNLVSYLIFCGDVHTGDVNCVQYEREDWKCCGVDAEHGDGFVDWTVISGNRPAANLWTSKIID